MILNRGELGKKYCWCCGAGMPEELLNIPGVKPYEWKIFAKLLENNGKVVMYESFPGTSYGQRSADPMTMDRLVVHINSLRRAMADVGSLYFIETVTQVGFKLVRVTEEQSEKLYSLSSYRRYRLVSLVHDNKPVPYPRPPQRRRNRSEVGRCLSSAL